MKEVAAEAGVSLGTVSKVMNRIPVGEPYRRKVEDAAKKLGYKINPVARALRTNKSGIIALVLPSIRNPFFSALANEITCILMDRGYQAQLMITNFDPDGEQKCIRAVQENKADGVIALSYRPDLIVDESIPFVTIDRFAGGHVPCVASDNYGGGQMAAEKLLSLGCRKLLFLRIGSTVSGEPDKRAAGFESICRANQIPYDMVYLHDGEPEKLFDEYLNDHFKDGVFGYDGIFCNTDYLAIRAVDHLRFLGVKVPEDVQIIGFDGITDYISGKYVCSTIVQPVREIAATAVRLLLGEGPAEKQALVILPVSYASGGTTKE
ncbi:MAG: LacI family transcriptional regulator [Lachnospiraceae bacterium]|nr:LacI family transcriptional regulator [Lachnospiraceae bacterium]